MNEKRKILIVNNNLQMGGIQKSLLNLINALKNDFDITLLLYSKYGELFSEITEEVEVVYAAAPFQILGTPWSELKRTPILAIYKIIINIINKVLGKKIAFRAISIFQKKIEGFTHAISFSHCTPEKNISICTPEFVLNCVNAETKICYIHCDYANSDTASEYNNNIYRKFDKIACCSASVRERFLSIVPDVREKTYVSRNFLDLTITEKADIESYQYDERYVNLISVARLSEEKGIFRAIRALCEAKCKHIRYYVIGDGPQRGEIERFIVENKMEEQVFLLGEQLNPYRFMVNADYLLVPSYHEAAPMVFDEAHMLGVRILSTNTTSAMEMLDKTNDIVCSEIDVAVFTSLRKLGKSKKNVLSNEGSKRMFMNLLETS